MGAGMQLLEALQYTFMYLLVHRGLAGTCVVYKIAGALAKRGASLDEVYSTAQWVASRVGTIGVGLEHCHVCCFGTHWLSD